MRVMVCSDVLIGDSAALGMEPATLKTWQHDKVGALAAALTDAARHGARAGIIAGGLFADGFVTQSLYASCVEVLAQAPIMLAYLPRDGEATDLVDRVMVPETVEIIREGVSRPVDGVTVVQAGPTTEVTLLGATGPVSLRLDPLEPAGFGDRARSGYVLVDLEEGRATGVRRYASASHPFVVRRIDVTGITDQTLVLEAVRESLDDVPASACLRIVLSGAAALETSFDATTLTHALAKRFFYVEAEDERTVETDEESSAEGASLLAEFVRMVSTDDTLSLTERARILRCGYNALNGRRLAE